MKAGLKNDFTDLMIIDSQGDFTDLNIAKSADMGKKNEIIFN